MSWYTKNNKQLEQELETNFTSGLTPQQVEKRLKDDGYNELAKVKQLHWIFVFFKALFEPLSIILMSAAIFSLVISIINKHVEYIDVIVIFSIVILNAIISCFQEIKARKSIAALEKLTEPKVVVLREKQQVEILARNLVIGDIVILEAGKYVPADIRLIEAQRLLVDESSITGEPINVNKISDVIAKENLLLADQLNMVFMSTFITNGRAIGIVVATAKNSQIGKIAKSISENKTLPTVLQMKMRNLSKWLSILAICISAIIFTVLFFTNQKSLWVNHLLVATTLAVAVIPESLSIIISITLAVSVGKMAKKNVIVKKLSSVETLGTVSIICTDKTGTLTQNKMQIEHYFYNNNLYLQNDVNLFDLNQDNYFLYSLALCSDAVNSNNEKVGDPTEIALVDWLMKFNLKEVELRSKFKRLEEIPFDSDRKLMTTVNNINDQQFVFTKGAIDNLLTKCNAINIANKTSELSEKMKQDILQQANQISAKSLRILGFAYKHNKHNNNLEEELIFLGFVAMKDPLREEAKSAVAQAKKAHIRVIMITGDHKITAFAIAKELELVHQYEQVLTGKELNLMDEKKLSEVIDNINVFARVNPEHKERIVTCLQKKNNIVAMTGDGVNDAPSLSKADIGLAMGISGTDVSKQASDVILADDNFSTIVKGVGEGRNIYQKILRCITFILSANLAEVLAIFMIVAISNTMPLKVINVLWFNLIVESILAIPIAFDRNDQTLMFNQPRSKKESIFKMILKPSIVVAILLATIVIATFYIMKTLYNVEIASSSAFMVLINAPIFYIATIRLSNSPLSKPVNKISFAMLIAMILAFCLNAMILFIPYINTQICQVAVLKWKVILVNYGLSLVPLLLIVSYKTMTYLIRKYN